MGFEFQIIFHKLNAQTLVGWSSIDRRGKVCRTPPISSAAYFVLLKIKQEFIWSLLLFFFWPKVVGLNRIRSFGLF